ncbi:1,2-phenylacetyl-CoA epoxidase subunit PaaD [Mechercharimyces sp. CAU 1602]|uniref:1,2-phenylacetyl-CoA epoxidase subunit PaaD n=1 Tax=Mechercharimyces sp. CAU 1602 TaxID=2973933 RepID=UPI002162AF21|nr:1,2-phenylacetyl-CoA epoxidase subunit PaaD [Mechercharimyces sp. CAU 1602]MCS1351726.1 phenylacetate-CoA oxygenase subunit PaaJ [Mechercharimyces sp. CAU 1602]
MLLLSGKTKSTELGVIKVIVSEQEIWLELQEVKDPEIPTVSVVELGMVQEVEVDGCRVNVFLIPTFVGCPAIEMIKKNVKERLLALANVEEVVVTFLRTPIWTNDRILPVGKEKLKSFGIAPAQSTLKEHAPPSIPACPYCGKEEGEVENLFGSAACRSLYYCKNCRQPFEAMKPV